MRNSGFQCLKTFDLLRAAIPVAAVLLVNGCVSQTVVPEYSPRVTAAQNSDGMVVLSWPSRQGYDYTLLVMDEESRSWKPVKGTKIYRGTGGLITIQDKRDPRKPLPWYSVQARKR